MKARLILAAALAFAGAVALPAQVGKVPDGFTPVFDGETTKGWRVSRTTPHGSSENAIVENGKLVLRRNPCGEGGLSFIDTRCGCSGVNLDVNQVR